MKKQNHLFLNFLVRSKNFQNQNNFIYIFKSVARPIFWKKKSQEQEIKLM